MLKKFKDLGTKFVPGAEVFLVTRKGEILTGFTIRSVLVDLVTLDPEGGFTIKEDRLVPNWCEGRRRYYGATLSREKAEELAKRRSRCESSLPQLSS